MFRIVQEFKGTVGTEVVTSQSLFYLLEYMYDYINYTYSSIDLDSLIKDLHIAVELQYLKSNLTYPEIERELCECIDNSPAFKSLRFEVYGYDHYFKEINQAIKSGKYSKE